MMAAGSLTPADAWDNVQPVLADAWQAAKDPAFWTDAARQYGQAMLAGSVAPGVGPVSKILDETGMPKVVYHGTTAQFSKFDKAFRGDNTGAGGAHDAFFFAGDPNDTGLYIEMAQNRAYDARQDVPDGRVIKAHLSAKNPLILSPFEDANVPQHIYDHLIDDDTTAISYAKRNGHDAVIWPHGNNNNSAYTAAVFDPEQIHQLPSGE